MYASKQYRVSYYIWSVLLFIWQNLYAYISLKLCEAYLMSSSLIETKSMGPYSLLKIPENVNKQYEINLKPQLSWIKISNNG